MVPFLLPLLLEILCYRFSGKSFVVEFSNTPLPTALPA